MKTLAIISFALCAAGAAHAGNVGQQEYDEHNRQPFTSSLTRAEVRAQYAEAVRDGTMPQYGEDSGAFAINQQAGSSRDVGAVRDEAILAARTRVVQELMV